MTTLPHIVTVVGSLALFAMTASAQDNPPRRSELQPNAQSGAEGVVPRGGRQAIPPPRMGPPPGPWVEERFQRSVDLGAGGSLELSNVFGEIRVHGVDGNTVRIAAIKRVSEQNREAARALLQNIVIRITERGGGLEVFTENLTRSRAPTVVDYDVAVPTATNVSIRSPFGGTVRISNDKG
jgi:hypothetical protein